MKIRSLVLLIVVVTVAVALIACDDVLGQIRAAARAAGPEINLKVGDTSYTVGSTIPVPWTSPNQPGSLTINVENVGGDALHLSGSPTASLVNTSGSAFSVTSYPRSAIEPGGRDGLVIRFLPTAVGQYAATVSLSSDDADESPYSVDLQGDCFALGSVVAPAAGAACQPGTTCAIQWTDFPGGNVTIELLKGGSLNSLITASTADDGGYDWTIPAGQAQGTDYQIRITSVELGQPDTGAAFAIGSISSVVPNGAEAFKPGQNPTISWQSGIGGNVNIQLWKAGSLHSVIASNVANAGTYAGWSVPALNDDDFRVRVISAANASIYDESDADFAIGTIGSVTPTGGAFTPGSTTTIGWSSGIGGTVKLELLKDGVVQGAAITLSTANDGSHPGWVVPAGGSGTGYKIRVTSNENPAIFNESDVSFSIGTIVVTAPNAVVGFNQGETATITWTSDLGGTVRIQLLKDGSVYGADIVSSKSNTSGFTHSWTIPGTQKPSVHYRVRISSNLNSAIYDDSDNEFKIKGWDPYGEYAGSGTAGRIDLAMGTDSLPVVTYMDAVSRDAVVKRWSGSGWTSYGPGNANPLPDDVGPYRFHAIGLSSSNAVYLAYVSEAAAEGLKVHLRSYYTGIWHDLGYGSPGAAFDLSMAVDIVNSPFVAYIDQSAYQVRPRALRLYGSTWEDKGQADTAHSLMTSVTLANYWDPVVAYVTYDVTPYAVRVRRWFSGTQWVDYGTASGTTGGLFPAVVNQKDLSVPYVVFMEGNDQNNGGAIRVKQYSGTGWNDCGTLGTGKWNDIVLDPGDNQPFVVFQDFGNAGKATLAKYVSGTNWTPLGSYEYTLGYGAFDVQVVVDPADKMPVIAFYDAGGYLRVVKRVY